jgi:hypothetical protein
MELITILNRCHRFRGFVYHRANFSRDHKSIEVSVRPRKGSTAICSRCHLPAPGYDQLAERRFEFIPLWGFFVFLLYAMRRVDCRHCGAVVIEEVPWGDGKRTLDQSLYALPSLLGAPPFLERNGRSIPHFLGKGFLTRSSMSSRGGWSTGLWARSTPSALMKSTTPRATNT